MTLGQYFTTDRSLQNTVVNFICNKPDRILEPSVGRGHLVERILDTFPCMEFDLYEIDPDMDFLPRVAAMHVNLGDFLHPSISTTTRYDTIVGNPPYVHTPQGNLYIQFISKCLDLLVEGGELIFIVPSDFIKLTSASRLLTRMMHEGTFTHIYTPHNDKLFEGATIDIMVFRYCRDPRLAKICRLNGVDNYLVCTDGIITMSLSANTTHPPLGEFFDIHVGLVSGMDKVFKNSELGNIDVRTDLNKIEKFIMVDPEHMALLAPQKDQLMKRRIRKFTDDNWWEWGAPRNHRVMQTRRGSHCIYVKTLTRSSTVAVRGVVENFGGGLLVMIPRREVDLDEVVEYINSPRVREQYTYSGRFKIGNKQLKNLQWVYP